MRYLLTFLLAFTLSLNAYAQKEAKLNSKGIEYAKIGELKKALECFNEAISINPEFWSAYPNRANIYREQGQPGLAIADYNKSLEYNPGNTHILFARGKTYVDLKSYDKALADFTAIIEREPTYPDVYFKRALTYIIQGNYEKAKTDLEQQLKLTPKDFATTANLIGIKRKLKLLREALTDYDKLLKDFPNAEDLQIVYNNRAGLYYDLKEYENALIEVNKALKIKDNYDMGYLTRAEIYYKMGNKEETCANYHKALDLGIESNRFFESDEDYVGIRKMCE